MIFRWVYKWFIYEFTCDFIIHMDASNWQNPLNHMANTTRFADLQYVYVKKHIYMGVSKKKGHPQIMNFNRVFQFSIINHPFWGTPIL